MFDKGFGKFACAGDTITCAVDGFDFTARIERDDSGDKPDERDDGFWPSRDKAAAGYVLPKNYESEMAKATRVMDAWKNDEWFYCGVVVSVSRNGVALSDHAASLWGVECNYPDSDNSYLLEVANELLPEALADARMIQAAIGADTRKTPDLIAEFDDAFIIRAVNNHAALVEALKGALSAMIELANAAGDVAEWNVGGFAYEATESIRAALTAAGAP